MHFLAAVVCLSTLAAGPEYLDDRFQMPQGFRIYKAASRDLCGASLDITFDGEGRLLVGDGKNVRRLIDEDRDGVYDRSEVIAEGLGGRGPQGLLVYGDQLYAVGGDGIQVFDGYRSGAELRHRGRIGERFNTGGDHSAHTILRGHDGYVYFITGDGGGTKDRRHITQKRSPVMFERACSVFRVSPDGKDWECVGSGGRNSPNVGINYLAEMFSFDSDMEWHVDLPWWRPVRVHHWLQGGDQGWQGVGAYPPYYIDCLPGIVDVGRGSPDWGVFYEHVGLPEKFRDAYLCCDYMWKSPTTNGYSTTGQLYSFFFDRKGAGWSAKPEILVKPEPGAKDGSGRRIAFGLVDIAIAPDGSLFLSEHNQGVWRVLWDPDGTRTAKGAPAVAPRPGELPDGEDAKLEMLVSLPQPASEWSRLREVALRETMPNDGVVALSALARDGTKQIRRRLRAIRCLAPRFATLPRELLADLSSDGSWEIRAQAAWLLGLRGERTDAETVRRELLDDRDSFVRRRALEALIRSDVPSSWVGDLVGRLDTGERLERYAAMVALSRHPTSAFLDVGVARDSTQAKLRTLVAAVSRREPAPAEIARRVLAGPILERLDRDSSVEDRLDHLRTISLYRDAVRGNETTRERVERFLVESFPDSNDDLRREQARLIGELDVAEGFGKLLAALEAEEAHVEQFHLAKCLSRVSTGWTEEEEARAVRWFLSTQSGWFAEFGGKGRQFPSFWATVVNDFVRRHSAAVLSRLSELKLDGTLGKSALNSIADSPGAATTLVGVYRSVEQPDARFRLLRVLRRVRGAEVASLVREEYLRVTDNGTRGQLLQVLAAQHPAEGNRELLVEGLDHDTDDVFRECAVALSRFEVKVDGRLARVLVTQLSQSRGRFRACEKLLVERGGARRDGYNPKQDIRRAPKDDAWKTGVTFWKSWYADAFGKPFEPVARARIEEKSDAAVREFLLSDRARGGESKRGRKIYEKARCATCHGGVERTKGTSIFGPDLAGVTQRLKREEFVDSIVYPSRQVADRFKAKVVQTKTGVPLTGFITEETKDTVTLVDPDRVHRIPRAKILLIVPQETSLMPERLLTRLSWEEIRDLAAFLDELGAAPARKNE
jgi:putative heme-binding domain-containing protein